MNELSACGQAPPFIAKSQAKIPNRKAMALTIFITPYKSTKILPPTLAFRSLFIFQPLRFVCVFPGRGFQSRFERLVHAPKSVSYFSFFAGAFAMSNPQWKPDDAFYAACGTAITNWQQVEAEMWRLLATIVTINFRHKVSAVEGATRYGVGP